MKWFGPREKSLGLLPPLKDKCTWCYSTSNIYLQPIFTPRDISIPYLDLQVKKSNFKFCNKCGTIFDYNYHAWEPVLEWKVAGMQKEIRKIFFLTLKKCGNKLYIPKKVNNRCIDGIYNMEEEIKNRPTTPDIRLIPD